MVRQQRSTQRKPPRGADDEARLTAEIIDLAKRYGRYGYRRIPALLRDAGWLINDKRVERIWRREGLRVPTKQPKRGRLWLNDGSCIRLRPEHRNHVWSYDFVEDRTHDGKKFRMLNVVDEFTRECMAIRVARKLKAVDVIDVLSDLFILRGVPAYIRSDNGPEFVGKPFKARVVDLGLEHHRIPPRSPNHNAVCERFHGTVLHEFYRPHFHRGRVDDVALLDRSLQAWIVDYNHHRPNHGDYMAGRTPLEVKRHLTRRIRKTAA